MTSRFTNDFNQDHPNGTFDADFNEPDLLHPDTDNEAPGDGRRGVGAESSGIGIADDRIDEAIDAVNLHTELLAKLTEAVAKLEGGDTGQGGWTAFAVDPDRFEADQKRLDARMLELRRWVQWAHPVLFAPSLPDPLPGCWASHPGVIEELLALYAAWVASYTVANPGESAIAWHDRWLQPCLHRIWSVYGLNACSRNGRHEDRRPVQTRDNGEMIELVNPQTSETREAPEPAGVGA